MPTDSPAAPSPTAPRTAPRPTAWLASLALAVLLLALPSCQSTPQPGTLRIACVGDSITEGTANADSARNSWPQLLGRLLDREYPARYETANFGRSGATLLRAGHKPYWDQDVYGLSLAWQPGAVVINLGTNDAWLQNWTEHGGAFEADLRDLIATYQELPSRPQVWLSTLTAHIEPHPKAAQCAPHRKQIATILSEVAADLDLPLIDLSTPTAGVPELLPDGLHPNTAANERMARAVFEALTGEPAPHDDSLRPAGVDGEPHVLVEAGQAVDVHLGTWAPGTEALIGSGSGQRLRANVRLGESDFHLTARLRMLGQENSAAGFALGDTFFGFEGAAGTVFRNGPQVGGLRLLHPSPSLWERDAWIDFEVIRNDETVWFVVDGFIVDMALLPGPVDQLAFEPMRSTMQIAEWTVTGHTTRVVPAHMAARTKATPWIDLSRRDELIEVELNGHPQLAPFSYGDDIRSKDGQLLLRVLGSALYTTCRLSRDEGETWSEPWSLPPVLAGTGHSATWLPDDRLLISFHDTYPASPTHGDVVAWVGTWDDLVEQHEGQFTVRIIDHATGDHSRNAITRELADEIPEDLIQDDTHRDRLVGQKLAMAIGSRTDPEVDEEGTITVRALCTNLLRDRMTRTTARFTLEHLRELLPTPGYEIPLIDLAHDEGRHVVVDREPGQYLGHVTTALLEDGETILTVFPKGHGRGPIVYKRSDDGGLTWSERLPTPENWATSREVPTIHRMIDPVTGNKRLIVWSGLYPARLAVSEDDGASWSQLDPAGDWGGIVVMGFVERLNDGRYLAMFHDDGRFYTGEDLRVDPPLFTLYQTFSDDGGLSWSHPEPVWSGSDVHLCEPGVVRSPDGSTLAVLLRENSRTRNSYVIFSRDEGASWSAPRELPASLTGDRHTTRYAPDGRLFISFRDTTRDSPTQGDWVGWVGTFDDILLGRQGQYRVRLGDNQHRWDSTYPGVEVLPDGTFVVTTYGHWEADEEPYILSARFTLAELDQRASLLLTR